MNTDHELLEGIATKLNQLARLRSLAERVEKYIETINDDKSSGQDIVEAEAKMEQALSDYLKEKTSKPDGI